VSDPWNDEGFGGETEWGEESLESGSEEESLFEPVELEEEDDDLEADEEVDS
jgi:hypothetical protein